MALLLSTLAIAILAYLIYHFIIYPAVLSPLSALPPAHPTSPFLPTWLHWVRHRGREGRSIHAAHAAHGPIVRLGPSEVSVAFVAALRTVYVGTTASHAGTGHHARTGHPSSGSGGFERTPWFLQFRNYGGTANLVTLLDGRAHAARRRIVAHVYSRAHLAGSAEFQAVAGRAVVRRVLGELAGAAGAERGVEVLGLGAGAGAEVMSGYALGMGNGMELVGEGREGARRAYLEDGRRKVRALKGHRAATRRLEEQCLEMCDKAQAQLDEDKMAREGLQEDSKTSRTHPVVYARLMEAIPAKEDITSAEETRLLVASELLDNIEASREGIGIALTYIMYNLSQRPALQSTLRGELASLKSSLGYMDPIPLSTSALRSLDSIPLLDAIITETLRLNPPAPGAQRRVVPRNGAVIEGYAIPGGVTISASLYTMHRYEGAYPDADTWKPERWIGIGNAKGEKSESGAREPNKPAGQYDPRRWFCSFGQGGRMCVGNNFSILVLKLLIAATYTNFTSSIEDDEGIEQRDDFLGSPVGNKLILRFKHAT